MGYWGLFTSKGSNTQLVDHAHTGDCTWHAPRHESVHLVSCVATTPNQHSMHNFLQDAAFCRES